MECFLTVINQRLFFLKVMRSSLFVQRLSGHSFIVFFLRGVFSYPEIDSEGIITTNLLEITNVSESCMPVAALMLSHKAEFAQFSFNLSYNLEC